MAEQRKYSVDEIDRMRRAIEWSYGDGVFTMADRQADVENRLRTHMINGTDPEELENEASRLQAARIEQQRLVEEYRKKK